MSSEPENYICDHLCQGDVSIELCRRWLRDKEQSEKIRGQDWASFPALHCTFFSPKIPSLPAPQNTLSRWLCCPLYQGQLPWWLSGKEPTCQCRRPMFDPLGREDPLEKEMATHSSILAWRIPWTEEPGGLQSMGSQRLGHDWVTNMFICTLTKDTKPWVENPLIFLPPNQHAYLQSRLSYVSSCQRPEPRSVLPSPLLSNPVHQPSPRSSNSRDESTPQGLPNRCHLLKTLLQRVVPCLPPPPEFLLFSHSVVSDSLQPHEQQRTRLPCPSLSHRACSNLCPLSQWCHPNISSSVIPFSSCTRNLSQHQGLFQWVGFSHQVAKGLELQLQHQ